MGSKNKKNKGQKGGDSSAEAANGGGKVITDPRFSSAQWDPRFQNVPRHKSKVVIDSRFNRMFTDKNFSISSARVDKRGKTRKDDPSQHPLKQYYSINEDNEDEGEKKRSEESDSEPEKERKKLKDSGKAKSKLVESESESDSDSLSDEAEEDEGDMEESDGSSTSTSDSDEDEGISSQEEDNIFQEENIPEIDKETSRLAVVNMDWDRVRSVDLYVLLSSFLPKGGQILKVSVYPSEFGLERMKEEELRGPVWVFDDNKGEGNDNKNLMRGEDGEEVKNELDDNEDEGDEIDNKKLTRGEDDDEEEEEYELDDDDSEGDEIDNTKLMSGEDDEEEEENELNDVDSEGDEIDNEELMMGKNDSSDEQEEFDDKKLRAYELSKLRYYFAVVECDSIATADYIYKTCDGSEFERSSNKLDLRFIPVSMEFKHEARDYCTEAPDNYKGIDFHTQALQLSKIKLTWDENEPQRSKKLKRNFDADQESEYQKAEAELKEFIASSDDSDEDDDGDANSDGCRSAKRRKKEEIYRSLIENGDGSDEEEEEDMDMEVTFNTGLEDLSKKILEKKSKESETVWESYLRKRREKKKARKNRSKDSSEDDSSDDDGEPIVEADDFFTEEPSRKRKEANGKKARKEKQVSKKEDKEAAASRAELELLLAEDEDAGAHLKGYNLKHKKAKGKKGRETIDEEKIPAVNYDDPRFSSLFTSPNFALDPTDPQFKRSAAYARQVAQKQHKGDEEKRKKDDTELPLLAQVSDNVGTGKDEALVSDRVNSKKEKHEMSMLLKSVKMKSKQVKLHQNGNTSRRKAK